MQSCVYQGTVRHRRQSPVPHAFEYRLFMLYLDLAELPTVFRGRWCWSARRPAPAWFRRADYLGDPAMPLDRAVRDLVAARTGTRPDGPIRLLTHLRYFGYVQNPVSFYYCFDPAGARVETIVAEITNTPWGERHAYVLEVKADGAAEHAFTLEKEFHVSPFMPMDVTYDWRFSDPGDGLAVRMENHAAGERVFDVALDLERRPLSGPVLASALARFPWMTLTIVAGIYWQAFRLWLRGARFHPHPAIRRPDGPAVLSR